MSTPTRSESDSDAPPPEHTASQVVPVTVPRTVEVEARSRARRLNEAIEDVLADHVTVVPDYCISPAEGDRVPATPARRVALHTTVEPALAGVVDELADDRREWVREAIREKAGEERPDDGASGTATTPEATAPDDRN